jgi:hypothetical protein
MATATAPSSATSGNLGKPARNRTCNNRPPPRAHLALPAVDGVRALRQMERGLYIAAIIVLAVAVVVLASAVVRLENYRYANFIGFCSQFDITSPQQRIEREKCLETTQTRTHRFWHIVYGVGLL